jgi:hypothetical protein
MCIARDLGAGSLWEVHSFSLSPLYNPTYLVQHQNQNVRRLPYVVRIHDSMGPLKLSECSLSNLPEANTRESRTAVLWPLLLHQIVRQAKSDGGTYRTTDHGLQTPGASDDDWNDVRLGGRRVVPYPLIE